MVRRVRYAKSQSGSPSKSGNRLAFPNQNAPFASARNDDPETPHQVHIRVSEHGLTFRQEGQAPFRIVNRNNDGDWHLVNCITGTRAALLMNCNRPKSCGDRGELKEQYRIAAKSPATKPRHAAADQGCLGGRHLCQGPQRDGLGNRYFLESAIALNGGVTGETNVRLDTFQKS
jgi:hypothetical protein